MPRRFDAAGASDRLDRKLVEDERNDLSGRDFFAPEISRSSPQTRSRLQSIQPSLRST